MNIALWHATRLKSTAKEGFQCDWYSRTRISHWPTMRYGLSLETKGYDKTVETSVQKVYTQSEKPVVPGGCSWALANPT